MNIETSSNMFNNFEKTELKINICWTEKLLSRTTLSPSLSNPRCFAFLSFESSLAEDVEARNKPGCKFCI